MDSNLTTYYQAIQTDRTRLPAQAERGWLADQAAAAQPRRSKIAPLRQWIGATLILAGKHVRGTAEPTLGAIVPDQRPASMQDA